MPYATRSNKCNNVVALGRNYSLQLQKAAGAARARRPGRCYHDVTSRRNSTSSLRLNKKIGSFFVFFVWHSSAAPGKLSGQPVPVGLGWGHLVSLRGARGTQAALNFALPRTPPIKKIKLHSQFLAPYPFRVTARPQAASGSQAEPEARRALSAERPAAGCARAGPSRARRWRSRTLPAHMPLAAPRHPWPFPKSGRVTGSFSTTPVNAGPGPGPAAKQQLQVTHCDSRTRSAEHARPGRPPRPRQVQVQVLTQNREA